jgi:hypothetical protein
MFVPGVERGFSPGDFGLLGTRIKNVQQTKPIGRQKGPWKSLCFPHKKASTELGVFGHRNSTGYEVSCA